MQPIKIKVNATRAVCTERPDPITTGMVGLRAEFSFSADWDGLQETAVCVGSGVTRDILDVQDAITVPHECLTDPASELKIGVYGVNSSGDLVIPTVYAYCGRLFRGADPSGDESVDPTLPIWAQLQAMIGDLSNLTTTARDNLVAAINEAAKSGGGSGTAADVRMQVADGYIQYSTDGGTTWRNLIAVAELIGAPGKSAYDYAEEAGYTGTETEFAARLAAEIPTVDSTLTKIGQAADAAEVGNRLSALSEEMLTEESDPTVPAWAKEAQKPSYTASEVGADPSGTAAAQVATHNSGTDTHSDIRILIQGLTDRLNALADSDDTTLDQLSEVVAYIKSNRGLIEAITTSKVGVADIVDNLTTNVANKPLSAAQGVALKALIDAITIPEALPNPNALTFTGAVSGSYDGSAPLEVEISSGGGGDGVWEYLGEFTNDAQPTFEIGKYNLFFINGYATVESINSSAYLRPSIDGTRHFPWTIAFNSVGKKFFGLFAPKFSVAYITNGSEYMGLTDRGNAIISMAESDDLSKGTAYITLSGGGASNATLTDYNMQIYGKP